MTRIGGLLLIVRRGLTQHALSTIVTATSVALGVGLVMAVFAVSAQSRLAFTSGAGNFDAVLGARGSALQLVLNAVFHLETSPGNIPWQLYEEVRADPRVALAIPYAVGDNYRGYRIVGTTSELFSAVEFRPGRRYAFRGKGRAFDPERREAVIGHMVAARTDLKLGARFQPYHGIAFNSEARHAEEYVVVGVLEPTGTPADRVVWIPIDGIFRMDGHVLRGTGAEFTADPAAEIPDEHKEVSAVLLDFRDAKVGFTLEQLINKQGKVATLAWPVQQIMATLFEKLGWMNRVLELVAYLVVAVAAGSILASLYNTMNERRREFAILRALGARPSTVLSVVVLEAVAIAGLGCVLGYGCYFAILAVAAELVRSATGVVLELDASHPALWWTPVCVLALGALAGLVPAARAYRTEVATYLAPTT
ncbi:MAG: ABC transporter permease [Planctomycetota bacterium]